MIVLDTSILSLAFRRRQRTEPEPYSVAALRRMVVEDVPLAIPGIVLQELLSGVQSDRQFSRLRNLLEPFAILMAEQADHVSAARIANACRRQGLAASTVDCLIAAVSISHDALLFTLDDDFSRMTAHCNLRLLPIPNGP